MAAAAKDATFEVEPLLPDGVRYTLPVRQLGPLRYLGYFMTLTGTALVVGGCYSIFSSLSDMLTADGGIDWFEAFGILSCLPLLLGGFLCLGIGELVRRGRNIITLRGGVLTTTEQAGVFHKSWRRNVDEIIGLLAFKAPAKVNNQPVKSGPLANIGFVKVNTADERRFVLAAGYPYSLCVALANDLGERLDTKVELPEPPWDFEGNVSTAQLQQEPLSQPAGSDISFDAFDDGVTLKIPPAGLKRGSKGLFGFSVLWCGFMIMFTAIFVFVGLAGGDKIEVGSMWVFVAFISVFWLLGIGMMTAALNMARRKAVLAVVDHSLMVLQSGLFGSKRREWTHKEIESIQFGPSGTQINDVPVMELQIHRRSGTKIGILSSRNNDELRWIADVLTRALRLGPEEITKQEQSPTT